MYTFYLQLVDLLRHGKVHYFLLFFLYVWFRWLVISIYANKHHDYAKRYSATTSVIIPVLDEEVESFKNVLRQIVKQRPHQVIVVINGPRNKKLEEACKTFSMVDVIWTKKAGKRNAIARGMKAVTGELTVLVDSDTLWTKSTLSELKKPFRDDKVGGVTTLQKITNPTASFLSILCHWMEEIRSTGSMRAMSATGKIGCLPGRTIAFRTSILRNVLGEFMFERFMGIHKEVSDDRSLTNLTLKLGYKTVMQESSVVYTDAPEKWKKFIRQQLRWAEGSQYNNMKMTPWMFKNAKLMFYVYWTDMITPFFLTGVLLTGLFTYGQNSSVYSSAPLGVLLMSSVFGAVLSVGLRQTIVMLRNPIFILYSLPLIITLAVVMTPIRIFGFYKLADDLGWGTRKSAYRTQQDTLNWKALFKLSVRKVAYEA